MRFRIAIVRDRQPSDVGSSHPFYFTLLLILPLPPAVAATATAAAADTPPPSSPPPFHPPPLPSTLTFHLVYPADCGLQGKSPLHDGSFDWGHQWHRAKFLILPAWHRGCNWSLGAEG
ncbi:hypothetical protein F4809DRAFT_522737 [Biscogniauxia mediterranea]|nr:hypothetical protein F4809DRAFT_522737 [Biscogniauxia mediterranea]